MLESIPYSIHSLNSLATLSENMNKKALAAHPNDAMILASTTKVTEALSHANAAIGSGSSSILTRQVTEADHLRDVCYRSLRDHVLAGLIRETNAPYQEASKRLWKAFENNNTLLASLPYREQTAALKSLFSDLDRQSDDMAVINGTEWLQELKDANSQFELLLNTRAESTAAEQVPTDEEAKALLTDAVKIFVTTVNSLWSFGQPAGITDTVNQLNQIIKEANTAMRKGSKGRGRSQSF